MDLQTALRDVARDLSESIEPDSLVTIGELVNAFEFLANKLTPKAETKTGVPTDWEATVFDAESGETTRETYSLLTANIGEAMKHIKSDLNVGYTLEGLSKVR